MYRYIFGDALPEAVLRPHRWLPALVRYFARRSTQADSRTIDEILSLGPGSVIRLGAQADQGVTLFAENVKLARAQPGCNGPRRAIQVSGTERRYG